MSSFARKHKIGEVCELIKGTSPTLKTEPGIYPLVVTAAFRRTSVSWQVEGPAVCVPLVSSTGHGDAAIHRVHYQEGRFALANLLVALVPRDQNICNAKYLYYVLQASKDELLVPLMQGTANVSLKERDIAGVEISLPAFDAQLRIVARIEEIAAKVREAQSLRINLMEQTLALPRALLSHKPSTRTIRVGRFATLRPPDVKVEPVEEYHFAGVYCFGRGVFRGQRKLGSEFQYPKLTRLRAGDFVYPKLMAWEGALGVVPTECDGLVVSTEFPVFEIDKEVMLPEVIDIYFRSPEVWPGLSGQSGGTNVRRRRLNPNDFLNLQMLWPDRKTQVAIKECLSRVSAIRAIQSETAVELDAMLPSILDKAFKGEF